MNRGAATPMTPLTDNNHPGEPLWARGLDARIVDISPTMAADWLEHNTGNRKEKRGKIDCYTRDMSYGRWSLTGEPIIFDREGVLRNGQNRLLACVRSGASFRSVVMWGVEPEAFKNMDRGASRTVGDVLGIEGIGDSNQLAGAAAFLWRSEKGYAFGGGGATQPTSEETLDVLERHPEIKNSLRWKLGATKAGLTPSLAIYLHYRFACLNAAKADAFFERLYSGEDLSSGNPILTLRNQLLAGLRLRQPLLVQQRAAWTILAWNAYRKGQQRKILKWVDGNMPEAV